MRSATGVGEKGVRGGDKEERKEGALVFVEHEFVYLFSFHS